MPVLREQDFERLAGRVVDQFLGGRAKLADAAAEEAASAGLNPDQIQRLVEAANTLTFLRMMDQRKAEGAGDLLHEFDPVDTRHVIRIVIDNAGAHIEPLEDCDSGLDTGGGEDELPDEMSSVRMNPAEGEPGHEDSREVEECEEACHEEHDPPGVITKKKSPPQRRDGGTQRPEQEAKQKEARLLRMRKLAGILEDQQRQATWAFEDMFRDLSDRFRRVYGPSYDAFEKDAMAEYGGDRVGLSVLNQLRSERRLQPIDTAALEKTAALGDHHVSDDTPELELFESLVKVAREAAELERSITWVKSQCSA
jgi:hypothetical protein